jgi:Xaa-Pro aminopeptidase
VASRRATAGVRIARQHNRNNEEQSMDLLPKKEAVDRLQRLQQWMQQNDVDALFVLQNADLYYFAGTVQMGLLCLPPSGEPLYLVQKSVSRAKAESPWERILPMPQLRQAPDLLASEGLSAFRRVGLELDVLPWSYFQRYQQVFPGVEFVDASESIRNARMIKSCYEVFQMRQAALMLKSAFSELPGWVKPGATELEVAARMEGYLRQLGHQGIVRMRGFNLEIGYGTISAGPSASYPTCFPGPVGFAGLYPAIPNAGSKHRLTEGQTVMVDVVGGFGGYLVDKTRVIAMGELPSEMYDAHAFVLDLMGDVEEILRPGIPGSDIYRLAIDRVNDSPYSDSFMGIGDSQVRFVGHGVGLELDELPVLAKGFDAPLEAGMTIAIEPKIFFPEHGGVGIENTYLITEESSEKLTVFPEEIMMGG